MQPTPIGDSRLLNDAYNGRDARMAASLGDR